MAQAERELRTQLGAIQSKFASGEVEEMLGNAKEIR